MMLARFCETPSVLVVAFSVLVGASSAKPFVAQNVENRNVYKSEPSEAAGQHMLMGNCTERLHLVYVETVVLAKDVNSLINGTIEVNLDSNLAPFSVACVRVQPRTEYDRRALAEITFLGPKQFTIAVQEQPPQQARAMQFEISVYRALPPRMKPNE